MKGPLYISLKETALGYAGSQAPVLSGLALDFYGGDFVGIVGLNGTGKSTLLKSLSGLIPQLGGELKIEGVQIGQVEIAELAKKISIVLTEKIGGFNLTVRDAVAAGRIPYTNSFNRLTDDDHRIIDEAIRQTNIGVFQNKPINELSDGMFQKTIIAKSLAQQTQVMLLDEPSAFLDYASKHDLFILLKKLAEEEGKCILISSHDLDLALRYCNKLCVVADGQASLINVEDAKSDPAFLRIGGGFI